MSVAARTVAVRRRMLEVLSMADDPLSTPQVCRLLADAGRNCNHYLARGRRCADPYLARGEVCRASCWHQPVYPQLRALERLGLVARVHYPNRESIAKAIAADTLLEHLAEADSRVVYWIRTADESDAAMNTALETTDNIG